MYIIVKIKTSELKMGPCSSYRESYRTLMQVDPCFYKWMDSPTTQLLGFIVYFLTKLRFEL